MYVKWGLDTIGADYFMKQLDEAPENFDLNDPLIQFLVFSIIVLWWPFLIISIIKDKNGEIEWDGIRFTMEEFKVC